MGTELGKDLAALKRLSVGKLREKYAEVFGEPTAGTNRTSLVRKIAWRLQERALGGLSERAKARAAELADDADLRVVPPRKGAADPVPAPPAPPPADSRLPAPGTVLTRTVYDGLGRVVSEWVGTNDTPASGEWSPTNNTAPANMVEVAVSEYDSGGVGDGLLTKSTQMPGSPYANRVTQMAYDWRDRQVAVKSGVEASESTTVNRPISYQVMDNLGEVTETDQYDGDGLSITTDANGDGVLDQPSAGALRAKSAAAYDELGRAYQEQTFSVDPSTGVVSANALTTNHWFDARGNEIKTASPGGLVSKTAFDGLGRAVTAYTTDGGGDAGYADAGTVTGDVVLTQAETQYDAAGNALEVTTRDRFHDQPDTATGALGSRLTEVSYLYYPYGVVSITDSAYTSRSSSSYNWNILFQGLKWQSAVGLYVGRARAYSPTLGRWLENDPIGFDAGDQNLYRAYANKPVSLRDFSGFDVCFTSISVTDKGSSIAANHGDEGKPYAKLGQKTEPVGSFAHGFQVVVNAEVTPDDDITNADVRQQVVQLTSETSNDNKTFQLSVSAIGSRKYIPRVLLTDFVEAMFIGNEDFWNIDMAQDGALTTAPGGAFRPNLDTALVKTTKDTITYVDFPGSDPAVTSIDPTKFSAFTSLYAFQVIAKNKGKKEGTLKARFWVFLDAKSDGKKWTGTSLMMPPMPQEWTAPK